MPLFKSKEKGTFKLAATEAKEVATLNGMRLIGGKKYSLKDGKSVTIVNIGWPRFTENWETTIMKTFPNGDYEYNTPGAKYTACFITVLKEDGSYQRFIPSEFKAAWDVTKPAEEYVPKDHTPFHIAEVPDNMKSMIRREADMRREKGEKIMGDIK